MRLKVIVLHNPSDPAQKLKPFQGRLLLR